MLPQSVWQPLGLAPKREYEFVLADGTAVSRSVSECHLSLPHGEARTPAILGEPGDDEPLLGVITLDILGVVFNPLSRTLQPMSMLLA